MSGESVCQFARSWVDVASFHTRLVVMFMNFTASVRKILDTPSYPSHMYEGDSYWTEIREIQFLRFLLEFALLFKVVRK
jgi:hypothetical protein